MARTRNWLTARKPVRLEEVTPDMLAPARKAADKSRLGQTVWPSTYYGREYVGTDCLLINAAAAFFLDGERPHGAAEGAQPLLTVLPADYFVGAVSS